MLDATVSSKLRPGRKCEAAGCDGIPRSGRIRGPSFVMAPRWNALSNECRRVHGRSARKHSRIERTRGVFDVRTMQQDAELAEGTVNEMDGRATW